MLASVGSVGDAYDNALAESFVDTFKTELIADRVWRTRSQLELAIVEYLGWFNHARLHRRSAIYRRPSSRPTRCGLRPPHSQERDRPSTAGLCAARYRQKS